MNAPWLTVEEVAEILRVPRSTVYEHVRRGAIPARRIGRHIRIPRAWAEAPLPISTTTTTQESAAHAPKSDTPRPAIGRGIEK